MKKIFEWIVYSSVNADKLSLTIKSFAAFVPTILIFTGLAHLKLEQGQIIMLIDSVATAVTALGSALLACSTVIGLMRKIFLTIAGTNAVLK